MIPRSRERTPGRFLAVLARSFPETARDLQLGARWLLRRRLFAVAAIGILAFGTATAGSILALVHGVLLRPLPYPHPQRLAVVWERNVPRQKGENVVSMDNFESWRARATSFASLAALVPDRATLRAGTPVSIRGAAVTPSWFRVVGVVPALGRGFDEAEAHDGAAVVLLSDALWRIRFAADRHVLGRDIELGSHPFRVVGVMPQGFEPPAFGWLGREQAYWVPFAATPQNRQWGRFLLVLGRLRPGVTVATADREMAAVAATIGRERASNRDWTADVVGLREQVASPVRTPLLALLVAAALILLSAVTNVAALALTHLRGREVELAVRGALGAGHGRIARQLWAEAALVFLAGGALGLLGAGAGVGLLRRVLPADLPRLGEVRLGGLEAVSVAALLGLALVALSLLHAAVARRHATTLPTRRLAGTRVVGARGERRLVVAQVALAVTLAIGAGLAARGFARLQHRQLGFEPRDVLSFRIALGSDRYDDPARLAFVDGLLRSLGGIPGVTATAAASQRPLTGAGPATSVHAVGPPSPTDPVADLRAVTPGFFRLLGMRLLAGSPPPVGVTAEPPRQVVVSAGLARELWPGKDPIGQTLVIDPEHHLEPEVVGVADDILMEGPTVPGRAAVYFGLGQWPSESFDLLLRSGLPLSGLLPALQHAVWSQDPELALTNLAALGEETREAMAQQRATTAVLAAFSACALLLAAAGVYAALALEVTLRRRELAVRAALGELPRSLVGRLAGGSVRLAALGWLFGSAAAAMLTRFMTAMLQGVEPLDPATFSTALALVLAMALAAAALPAWRAARVDPLAALQGEG